MPGCPTKEGQLSPGESIGIVHIIASEYSAIPFRPHSNDYVSVFSVNDLYLSCDGGGGRVVVQACLTLGLSTPSMAPT